MSDASPWQAAAVAVLIAFVVTPIARDIFRAYNVVDRPGRRKVHAYPTPRVGGVAVAAAWAVAVFWLPLDPVLLPWRLLPGVFVVFLTGLLDDFLTLGPLVKLSGQIVAAVLVFAGGVAFDSIGGVALPWWLSLAATVGWLLLAMNALNLIDGLDGLCAGLSMVAALALAAGGWIVDDVGLAAAALPFAGALLGFLFYNFNPATVFLGDSGALVAGCVLGGCTIAWSQTITSPWALPAPLLLLAVPLADVALSITRRWMRAAPIFTADRGHIHHRLLDCGRSVRGAALALYAAAAVAAALALLLASSRARGFELAIYLAFALLAWVGIRALRYSEFEVASRMLFGREFRHVVEMKSRMAQLAAALERADSDDEWWAALVQAAREAGWARLRRTGGAMDREHAFPHAAPALWTLRIPAPGGAVVEIDGGTATPDLSALAEAVRRTNRTGHGHEAGAARP